MSFHRTYIPKIFSVFLERIWRIHNIHPQFEEAPPDVQLELIGGNSCPGLALVVARSENCSTGFQQAQEACGEVDELKWKQNFLPLISATGHEVKKMSLLSDVSLGQNDLSECDILLEQLRLMTSQLRIYNLCLLLTLTRPRDSAVTTENAISKLHSSYLLILKRRVHWLHSQAEVNNVVDLDQPADPEVYLSQLTSCSASLDKLSSILMKIMSSN
jgi:hypothetical protein